MNASTRKSEENKIILPNFKGGREIPGEKVRGETGIRGGCPGRARNPRKIRE